jgi:hemerythrin
MQNFAWNPSFSVNVELIDKQHQFFINILQELNVAIKEMKTKEKLSEIFTKVGEYIQFHFQTEEKYFKEFNYEGAAEHIAKHQEFIVKINEIKQKLNNNEMEISFELLDYLEDWLVNHLNTLDKKYTDCFNSHGLY